MVSEAARNAVRTRSGGTSFTPMTGEFLKFEAEPETRFMEWYRKLRETR